MMKKILLTLLILIAWSSCDKKSIDKKTEKKEDSSHLEKKALDKEKKKVDLPKVNEKNIEEKTAKTTWEKVKLSDLNEGQKAQLEKAKKAQKELGPKLMKTVKSAMKSGGPVVAIEACSTKASVLTEEVAKTHRLKLGRTSHKLRNSKNVAPMWMSSINDGTHKAPSVFVGPKGELGWSAPIMTQGACTMCHGELSKMPAPLKAALAKTYPKDQATGFAKDDLRGWFWVEVAQ